MQWWEPEGNEPWDHWPDDVRQKDYSLDNFVLLFENRGYKKCSDGKLEIFYKKVALYAADGCFPDDRCFSHVCDQLCSGAWTSKLGPYEDIRHHTLGSLTGKQGEEFGEVFQILKRRCGVFGIVARTYFIVVFAVFPKLRRNRI